jgi:hypothetical protein
LEPTATDADHAGIVNVVGGSGATVVSPGAIGATIAGGGASNWFGQAFINRADGSFSFVGGGGSNSILRDAEGSVIGGGFFNRIETNTHVSAVGGGAENTIETGAHESVIGGGVVNAIRANAFKSAIGGGFWNTIQPDATYATIAGGAQNTIAAGSAYGTVPGGYLNTATNRAFAAGTRAKANHNGAFVWADSTDADFASTSSNQFLVRATGGVGINRQTQPAHWTWRVPCRRVGQSAAQISPAAGAGSPILTRPT